MRTTLLGLSVSAIAFIAYGIAPSGWIVYPIIIFGSIGGLATPAIQALVSKPVAADQHGAVQGVLTSLVGLSGVFGPLLATYLFRSTLPGRTPIRMLPGAAFFFAAGLASLATILAIASSRRIADACSPPQESD